MSWRCDVTHGLPLRSLSFVTPVGRRPIISLEMVILDILKVCSGLVNNSNLNHTYVSLTAILTKPWHRRSWENSNFQNGKLFTFDNSTINDLMWFKCLIRSSQTGRKIDFSEFFRNETGCYCLFYEDKRVSRKH